jgi:hypothetical protein
VLLPDTQLGRIGEEREAALLRSGAAGLEQVARAGDVTIYEVPDAVPILTGPGEARLTALGHDRVEGEVGTPGVYRLAVRWTPTWRAEAGDVCLREGADGMTEVVARSGGQFVLGVSALPRAPGCPDAPG